MMDSKNALLAKLSRLRQVAGVIVMLVGALVLLGWVFDIYELKSAYGNITMKANAALSLLLAGASLWAFNREGKKTLARSVGQVCAAIVTLIGVLTLSQHLFGWNLGIDQLLFTEPPGANATTSPGRMGPPASTCFTLSGIALLLLHARRAILLAQAFAIVVTLWALLAIIGFTYQAQEFYGIARYTGIALHTAVTLFLLGLGLLAARADQGIVAVISSDRAGSVMARRLLLAAIGVPFLLGWLGLLGERAGYYDLGAGAALLVLAIIIIFTALIWQSAARINQAGEKLREHEAELKKAQRLGNIGSWYWDAQTDVTTGSDELLRIYGFDPTRDTMPNFIAQDGWLYPHESWQRINTAAQQALATGSGYKLDVQAFRNGTPIWITTRSEVVRDVNGKIVGLRGTVQDITARQQAEEALRYQSQLTQNITDTAAVSIFVTDSAGRVTFLNPEAEKVFGYTLDELKGEPLHDKIHYRRPDGSPYPISECPLGRAYQGETVREFEDEFYRKDGTPVAVICSNVAMIENGAVTGVVLTVQDISARKVAEEQTAADLRAMTRLQQLGARSAQPEVSFAEMLGEIVEAAIAVTNADKGNLQLFDAAANALRLTAYHGFAEPFLKFFAVVDETEAAVCGAALQAAERVVVEDITQSPIFVGTPSLDVLLAENVRAVQSTPLVSSSGQTLGMISTHFSQPRRLSERELHWMDLIARQAADFIERKQAEEALRESEERLRLATEAAEMFSWETDHRTRRIKWSDNAARVLGCAPEELPDDSEQSTFFVLPEDREGVNREFEQAINEKKNTYMFEFRGHGPERERKFWQAQGLLVYDEGGNLIRSVGITQNVTKRKRAEMEREELLRKESAARALAEAANRSKDEFLAVVSHELRTPLNAILGYNRIIRSNLRDTEQIGKASEVIERNARVQLQLIEDLLDTARIISGKLRLEMRPIDLVPVLDEAVETMRPAMEAKGIELLVQYGLQPEILTADAVRLLQVIANLLANAIKFTPEGGQIELRLERGRRDEGGRSSGKDEGGRMKNESRNHLSSFIPHPSSFRLHPSKCVRIIVRDTGQGIAPEFLPYVFDRFRQSDSSSTRHYGGLGLGLALVKHLTELHGGRVEAFSTGIGCGATFTVTLPRAAPLELVVAEPAALTVSREVRVEDALPMPDTVTIAGLRLLLVDDQAEARMLLTNCLRESGAIVTAVASGDEALAILANPPDGVKPDILISDIAMPNEDGYAVLARVRALEVARGTAVSQQIPAIALTAMARGEDRLRAFAAGFQMHIAKPVEPAELVLVIANLVGPRRRGAVFH